MNINSEKFIFALKAEMEKTELLVEATDNQYTKLHYAAVHATLAQVCLAAYAASED